MCRTKPARPRLKFNSGSNPYARGSVKVYDKGCFIGIKKAGKMRPVCFFVGVCIVFPAFYAVTFQFPLIYEYVYL